MKNNFTRELIFAVALVVLAVLLLNPFHFWMPNIAVMCMLAIALALFGIFASFVLKEKVFDERDSVHRTLAGRNAFLSGATVIVLGIVFQGFKHSIDPWLVIALITMVIVKIASRIWTNNHL